MNALKRFYEDFITPNAQDIWHVAKVYTNVTVFWVLVALIMFFC
jgi:hypothetical protein